MLEERIDPFSYVPKYHQLYSLIKAKIENGDWEPNQTIPSERELEKTYNISRTTIRQALKQLEDYGFVYRELGRGTFVAPPKLHYSLHELTSFSRDMVNRGLTPGQKILNLDYVEPPSIVRQHLELSKDVEKVLYIERLRLADNEPIGLHFAYLPLHSDQKITLDEIHEYGSLYELLQSKFHIIPTNADETLEATIADAAEAELLGITKGSPLLFITRTVWSQHRKAMEYVKILYRADRYKYFIHMTRHE